MASDHRGDYVLGDGQKEYVSEFLAGDAAVARPCIFVAVTNEPRLTKESVRAVRAMIKETSVPESAIAPSQRRAVGQWPDPQDWRAASEVAVGVREEMRRSPEWALENVLGAHELRSEATAFESDDQPEQGEPAAGLPASKPAGVSADEWQAIERARFRSEEDYVMAYFFLLLDVDGDGQRDLVFEEVTNGVQSDGPTRVYRRVGDHFAGFGASPDNGDQHELYMQSFTGADSRLRWLKLRGRVYATHVARDYGSDTLRLFRPFQRDERSLAVVVRYRNELRISQHQQPEGLPPFEIPAPQWREMQATVRHISAGPAEAEQGVDRVVCPSFPAANADEADDEAGRFGPGHSSYESIADFALHMHGRCVPARLVDWFGRYDKRTGPGAAIWTRDSGASEGGEYEVRGVRRAVEVDAPFLSADPGRAN